MFGRGIILEFRPNLGSTKEDEVHPHRWWCEKPARGPAEDPGGRALWMMFTTIPLARLP
jgi:hypothetical protein